jgi:MFS family permease
MEKINGLRVIAGGLVAGVVINVCEFIVNGVILKDRWAAAMKALGKPTGYGATEMAAFLVWGFLVGIFAIWLYAAIRPRYGPGPKTAAIAGVALWVLGYLLASIPTVATHLFGRRLVAYGIAVGLVEAVGGTLLGAWLYKEPDPDAASPAGTSQ